MIKILVWWLIAPAFSIIFETNRSKYFLFLSLCTGSICACISLILGISKIYQILIFIISSMSAFWTIDKIKQPHESYSDGFYELMGKRGIVTEPIAPFKKGLVKINKKMWSADTLRNCSIETGSIVEVIATHGCNIIVEKIHEY